MSETIELGETGEAGEAGEASEMVESGIGRWLVLLRYMFVTKIKWDATVQYGQSDGGCPHKRHL